MVSFARSERRLEPENKTGVAGPKRSCCVDLDSLHEGGDASVAQIDTNESFMN
jgi:hypothetical protein